MNYFWTGIALILVFSAGSGCAMLLSDGRRPMRGGEFFALSWLLGTAFISLAQVLFGLICSGRSLRLSVGVLCIGLALLGGRRIPRTLGALQVPTTWTGRLGLIGVAAQVLVLFWLSTRQCFGWDGLTIWEFKARACFAYGGVPSWDYFSNPEWAWNHPNYPLCIPLLEGWVYGWIGECDQSCIRVLFPMFYLAGIVLIGSGCGRLTKHSRARYIGAAIPFFLPIIYQRNAGVFSGYADFPLGIFYLASIYYLLAYLREGRDLKLFLATSMVLPWIKDEGAILAICITGIAVLSTARQLGWKALFLPGPALGVICLWSACKHFMHVPNPAVFEPVSMSALLGNMSRSASIASATFYELIDYHSWSLLWPGIACALVQLVGIKQSKGSIWLSLALVFPILFYSSTYLFSLFYASYLAHLALSLPRLLLQIAPAGVFTIALAVASETRGRVEEGG